MNRNISESDYQRISGLAYKELIDQGCSQFLIHPTKFSFPNRELLIVSMQDYALKANVSVESIAPNCCRDGYVYRNIQPTMDLILYNKDSQFQRQRFTVAHEIGHVRLKHKIHTAQEEAEAHLYASQLLAPDVLILKMSDYFEYFNPMIISTICGVSLSAAEQKFKDYKLCQHIQTPYDERLLWQFKAYLRYCFSVPRVSHIEDIVAPLS